MKILLVNKYFNMHGGSETYFFGLADLLRQAGHEVIFFAMQDEKNLPCEQSAYFVSNVEFNGELTATQKLKAAFRMVYSFEAKKKISALIEKEKPDIIHINLFHRVLTASIVDAAKKHGIPVVLTMHDLNCVCPNHVMLDHGKICEACLHGNYWNCVKRVCFKDSRAKCLMAAIESDFNKRSGLYRKIDLFITPSECYKNKLEASGLTKSPIVHMKNFLPADTKYAVQGKRGDYVLYYGRLSAEKGILTLVRAMEKLENVPLIIVGTGPEEDAIRAEIESKKAEQAALQTQLDTATSQRAALDGYKSDESTLSTTQTALRNATVLLKARQEAETSLNESTEELRQTLQQTITTLNTQIDKAEAMLANLNDQRGKLQSMLESLSANPTDPQLADMAVQLLLSGTEAQLSLGEFQISSGRTQLEAGQTQLDSAREEYESAREEALKSANLDQLLNMNTLKQLIAAQNFSMPAGYIDGGEGDDNQYILKIGDAFDNVDELKSMVLCSIDGIGDVRLSDVADIELTDNADDSYAKVGKNRAVLLSIYKSSTASTSSVSNASTAAMKELMAENDGLHLTTIMDQGDYIKLIVNSVMSNLIEGAVLAIIVLALFLKDIRPTLVVAISMPLSVLFAIVMMYFSGITLNILSLSGLGLGVGMLVDNSVVVIENIYRLRGRGIPAPRAAVQGARQVAGAIVSSTLTTVCVFLPMVFTTGMVLELLSDMAWTITFSLLASLIVALTVVPCAGSTVLRKQKEIKHPWFDRFLNGYEKLLRFCLKRKAIPLTLAIVLLAVSVWRIATMGVMLIPDMGSNQLSIAVTVPADTEKEDAFATADAVMDAITNIDGVETVGAMSGGSDSTSSMLMMTGTEGTTDNTSFTYYVLLTDEGASNSKAIQQQILIEDDVGAAMRHDSRGKAAAGHHSGNFAQFLSVALNKAIHHTGGAQHHTGEHTIHRIATDGLDLTGTETDGGQQRGRP